MSSPIVSSIHRVDGSPLITAPTQRLSTQAGRRGFDMARQIVDNLRRVRRRGEKVDMILVSKQTNHYLTTAWLEMGMPSNTLPRDIDGIELRMGNTGTHAYAFLRDYIPWEKRKLKAEGTSVYGDGHKKLIAVEN